jgi:ankyrin repeat protein
MKGDNIMAKNFCIVVVLSVGLILGGCKDSQDSFEDSPIHIAVLFGNLDEIKSILAEKPELVNAKDDKGNTPLHVAGTILGNTEAVKFLISKSADVNAKNMKAATPLHEALRNMGNKEIAVLLIENGADVNSVEDVGGATPLHLAACQGFKEIVELLISKGADINAKDKTGGTVLHFFTHEGLEDDTDMIEFLISKGADINAKDNMAGGTPLHYASMSGYINIVQCLIDNGADIYCKGRGGMTPLMLAVNEGHKNVADLLRKHMTDIKEKQKDSRVETENNP